MNHLAADILFNCFVKRQGSFSRFRGSVRDTGLRKWVFPCSDNTIRFYYFYFCINDPYFSKFVKISLLFERSFYSCLHFFRVVCQLAFVCFIRECHVVYNSFSYIFMFSLKISILHFACVIQKYYPTISSYNIFILVI